MKSLIFVIALYSAGAAFNPFKNAADLTPAPDFRSRFAGEFVCTTQTFTCINGRDTIVSSKQTETIRVSFQPNDSILIDMRPYADAKKYAAVRLGDKRMVAVDEKGNFILNIPKGITSEKGRFIGSNSLEYQHWNQHHSGKVTGTVITAHRVGARPTP
jgi:hypothetical protein